MLINGCSDPFGNYLCQKLPEYSTNDQRNVICESVAQDHASKHQRVQLVNEITYNALTLVQDPYGNYVRSMFYLALSSVLTLYTGCPIYPRPQ